MSIRFASALLLLMPTAALAANPNADKPIIGPVPAWVHPSELPADTTKPDQTAVKLLLSDQQVNLLPNGSEIYSETAVRVQTAQGLAALGTITLPWKPDIGTLTVHKLQIIRNGKVIDLLAGGPGFTVVRRENNLEYAMLDGVLTAVFQPEGLQVGDILDMATTTKTSDPVFGGNSETFLFAGPAARALRLKMRAQWASTLPVRWREGEGLPAMRERKAGGMTEIGLTADNVEPVLPPKGAPARFALTRLIEASTLASWNQLSALFAPLYAKAATLKPDSPLKAEIARIAAASPDPARRAEAALALAQDQVRYVYLGMNDGNLVPADADLTWQRRFADCKGKTALLLALLHGLGIEAEPAIVSTRLGDGLDEQVPMVGLFDHVIVRATIAGKIHWLDGTRTGDVRLADIRVPSFRFALPLRTPGAGLERLIVPVPDKPLAEYSFKVDMTGGVSQPFPFHVEEVMRGDAALSTHLQLDNMAPDVRQQALRQYFVGQYGDVEPKRFSASWDAATGEEKLVMDGLETHDWKWSYEPDQTRIGWTADFDRPAGPHRDAPFAVDYPDYVRTKETILLPNGGKGFANQSADIERKVAGIEYRRHAKLDDGTYTIEMTRRAIAPEFPAADAPAAQQVLRDLAKDQALLGLTSAYVETPQEKAAALTIDPRSATDYYRRGRARADQKDIKGAIADLDRAIELDPTMGYAYSLRGRERWQAGEFDKALPDLERAVAIAPADVSGHVALAQLLAMQGRPTEALAEIERAVALAPDQPQLLATRGEIHRLLGHYDQALADAAAALKSDPANTASYETRINAYMGLKQPEKALVEARAAAAANPQLDYVHIMLGATLSKLDRRDEALQELAQAIAIKPSPTAYLTRANIRPMSDLAGRRADIAAALKLDPTMMIARYMAISTELLAHNYAAAIEATNAGLTKQPGDAWLLAARGMAYGQTKRQPDADKDFVAARAAAGKNGPALNNLCWEKATRNLALTAALADCDASLQVMGDAPNTYDSRGFVLYRLGRYQDAIDNYDRALKLKGDLAASLYMRGLAKRRLGKTADGDADVQAAKKLDPYVEKTFADYGVTG